MVDSSCESVVLHVIFVNARWKNGLGPMLVEITLALDVNNDSEGRTTLGAQSNQLSSHRIPRYYDGGELPGK